MIELTETRKTMTYAQARLVLRRHYRLIGVLADLKIGAGEKLAIVGKSCNKGGSPVESCVVREVSIEQDIAFVQAALGRLSEEQQNFIDLRFRKEFVIRRIALILYRSIGYTHALEKESLSSFIVALGKVPAGK